MSKESKTPKDRMRLGYIELMKLGRNISEDFFPAYWSRTSYSVGADYFSMDDKKLFPLPESQCINKKPNKMKKFFHTFRYQNGNIDRDITLAIVTTMLTTRVGVAVGYSVRTPEDRPILDGEDKEAELKALERSRGIALGRADKKPLDTLVFPRDYGLDRRVLRIVAHKWENRIKKDGAHAYIKGVPAPSEVSPNSEEEV